MRTTLHLNLPVWSLEYADAPLESALAVTSRAQTNLTVRKMPRQGYFVPNNTKLTLLLDAYRNGRDYMGLGLSMGMQPRTVYENVQR